MVPGPFLLNFGSVLRSPNPQKWCFRVGAVLFLRKSRFADQIRFWSDFWTICDQFWEYFEDIESSKMVFSCRRGAIFEKITFFKSDAVMD